MTSPLLAHSWRLARVATAALALTAAALTVSGSASAPVDPRSGSAGAAVDAGAPCLTSPSAHRVRADSGLNGVDPNDLTLAQTRQAEAKLTARVQKRGLNHKASLSRTTIDVYVHVIERDSGSGGVSKKRIKKQIDVLNKAYAGKTSSHSTKTAFKFKLKDTDHTRSSAWYHWDSPPEVGFSNDDVQAKRKLHRGGPEDLNVYLADLDDGLLGYATFPWATTLAQDGVVVLNASLPSGSAKSYNKGDTATHEVGHWLGLYHTFENGCASPGDSVDDTPYQADGGNIFSCDDLDTCLTAGRDPVHNFMSYGNDKCLTRFTAGQAERMATVWQSFRAPGSGS
jgi:Pregnancy-associated plasma protein-A